MERRQLIDWREGAGKTQEELALLIGVNPRTIIRLESGYTKRPNMELRRKYARFFGRTLDEVNAAIHGDSINGHTVSDLGLLVSLEQGAAEIRWWEPITLPALVQTERYARAVESLGPVRLSKAEISRRVAVRMRRQRVLDRLSLLHVLIDRSVLTRVTGGADAMAEQLAHLQSVSGRPNVSVRIVSDELAHPAGTGPFKILTGEGDFPTLTVVTHTVLGPAFSDLAIFRDRYTGLFAHLWELSHDIASVPESEPQHRR